MYLVYGEHEGVDLLDDNDDNDEDDNDVLSFNNPPLLSAPNPEQHHLSIPESDYDTPLASVDPSAGPRPGTLRNYHPNVPIAHPGGENHLQKMDRDVHAAIRHTENLYYPFASKAEFDLGYWLSEAALSQKEVDGFLHLEHVSCPMAVHAVYLNNRYRPRTTHLRSPHRGICAFGSKDCLKYLDGTINKSKSVRTRRKHL